ncbi:MAG TPA: ABC transporter permease [Chloroflexota bacterium]|nr:ABC transporter permease [Chloroflexota bacterium]
MGEALSTPAGAAFAAPVARSPRFWQLLGRHRAAMAGLIVLALLALLAIAAPLVSPYDPIQQKLSDALLDPSMSHPFGTDYLGRDILARMLYGARYSLAIGFVAVAFGITIGVPLGAVSGYYGGWVDLVVQRFVDLLLSFPGFLLALSLVAILGIGLENVIIAVGISTTPSFIRLTRASTLSVRQLTYIEAARASGARSGVIIFRHVLPNVVAPVIVQATLSLGSAILLAAGLGFLGLGVQPPTPEWGTMLGEGRNYIFSNPNMATFPGIAIFLAVLSFNLAGDGLRDALDPRLRKR